MTTRWLTVALSLATGVLVGCSSNPSPPPAAPPNEPQMQPAAGKASEQVRQQPQAESEEPTEESTVVTATGVAIEQPLAEACNVQLAEAFFEFDSNKLVPPATETLDKIATCVSTGPLKGKPILLVGRTDPRGTDTYNLNLGMSRAEAVAKYLEKHGVTPSSIRLDTEGKIGALPISRMYPIERRVDIRRSEPE